MAAPSRSGVGCGAQARAQAPEERGEAWRAADRAEERLALELGEGLAALVEVVGEQRPHRGLEPAERALAPTLLRVERGLVEADEAEALAAGARGVPQLGARLIEVGAHARDEGGVHQRFAAIGIEREGAREQ